MPDKASELVQGTLEMLILKTLALEPMHGYGIALRIEQVSNGVFRVNPDRSFPPSAAWSVRVGSGANGAPQKTTAARNTIS